MPIKIKNKGKTKIYQGSLRVIEHSNLAYVEPNKLVIKNNLYLFFNEYDYFYVNDFSKIFWNIK